MQLAETVGMLMLKYKTMMWMDFLLTILYIAV